MDYMISKLQTSGYTVIKNAFDDSEIRKFREIVLNNQHLMKNTRPTKSSRHLAGFHRFQQFEALHCLMTNNPKIIAFLNYIYPNNSYITIGLSDITINRSQGWHTDLLRNQYSKYLDDDACWGINSGGVYKFLLYLQNGRSLEVAKGMHLVKTPLNDAELASDIANISTVSIPVELGDVVVMDIRLPHRGATEEEMASEEFELNPKILVSTVFGGNDYPLTYQMQRGNFARLMNWDQSPALFDSFRRV